MLITAAADYAAGVTVLVPIYPDILQVLATQHTHPLLTSTGSHCAAAVCRRRRPPLPPPPTATACYQLPRACQHHGVRWQRAVPARGRAYARQGVRLLGHH